MTPKELEKVKAALDELTDLMLSKKSGWTEINKKRDEILHIIDSQAPKGGILPPFPEQEEGTKLPDHIQKQLDEGHTCKGKGICSVCGATLFEAAPNSAVIQAVKELLPDLEKAPCHCDEIADCYPATMQGPCWRCHHKAALAAVLNSSDGEG